MAFLMTPEGLQQLRKSEDVVILDVRSNLQDPNKGLKDYERNHIPDAFYFHLEHDLSGKVQKHGGSHPLPNIEEFSEKLGKVGVTHDKKVVIYDEGNDMYAPRAWWLLYYLGHEHTFVLEGGYNAWKRLGFKTTTKNPDYKPTKFFPKVKASEIVRIEEVKMLSKDSVLIDSRTKERYLGKVEPLYQKAGHIPGAKNFFWKNVLDEEGNWKSKEQLMEHFSSLKRYKEIIVSCGSGISACPNILALKIAGFENVKLYPGSFSDWISYDNNPIETKEE